MIAAIGLVLLVVGLLLQRISRPAFLSPQEEWEENVEVIGDLVALLGAGLLIASICILAWRHLP